MHSDFVSFMQAEVLPRQAANPNDIRLDGATTGGNREPAGRFQRHGVDWVVHADSHYEPLLIAFAAAKDGMDPFTEEETAHGQCLILKPELRDQQHSQHKHLYIYSWS